MYRLMDISGWLIGSICALTAVILAAEIGGQSASAQTDLPDVGNFYQMLQDYADQSAMSLSYLSRDWSELEQWRIRGRAKMQELLAFETEATPLQPEILQQTEEETYTKYLVRYSLTPHRKVEAFLLIPKGLTQPAPAVVALHDHGGFYYFGKEKITDTEGKPEVLRQFIDRSYGGRTFADELARRGFVVLCPDNFYFGSQRIDADQVPEHFTGQYPALQSQDQNEYIRAFNSFSGAHEQYMAKYIFASGTTWPGIMFHGDRVAVDYLLTRPEVDPQRIGCMGLSIGGFRSAHLFALDPRIKVGVVAGWMTTYKMQLFNKLRWHTWMIYVPKQLEFFDLPDVASLNAPNPLMVINCEQDQLYPLEAMQAADRKLAAIYKKMQAEDRYQCNYYDVPHSLDVEMQDDAIDWLEKWLATDE
ncbi:dienelactone hydrolase family protein [Candidatus Poribacteria bacterium]